MLCSWLELPSVASCGSCCCGSSGYAVVDSLRDVRCYATGELFGNPYVVMQLVGQ